MENKLSRKFQLLRSFLVSKTIPRIFYLFHFRTLCMDRRRSKNGYIADLALTSLSPIASGSRCLLWNRCHEKFYPSIENHRANFFAELDRAENPLLAFSPGRCCFFYSSWKLRFIRSSFSFLQLENIATRDRVFPVIDSVLRSRYFLFYLLVLYRNTVSTE